MNTVEIRKLKKQGMTLVEIAKVAKMPLTTISWRYHHKPNPRIRKYIAPVSFQGRDLWREEVRIRDNHTCSVCKRVWKESERRFDVHKKDSKSPGRGYKKGRNLDKWITVCHQCNMNLPENMKAMSKKRRAKAVAKYFGDITEEAL